MIKKTIPFKLTDNIDIHIEGDDQLWNKIQPSGTEDNESFNFVEAGLGKKAKQTINETCRSFSDSMTKINLLSNAMITQLSQPVDKGNRKFSPSEINVEFALKLGANVDFVIAAGDVEANFKISITWKK